MYSNVCVFVCVCVCVCVRAHLVGILTTRLLLPNRTETLLM